jgi:hypothetical protein
MKTWFSVMYKQPGYPWLGQQVETRAFEEGREEAWDALGGGSNRRMSIKRDTYIDVAETFGLAPDRVRAEFERGYTYGINHG